MSNVNPPFEDQVGAGDGNSLGNSQPILPSPPTKKVGLEMQPGTGDHFMSSDAAPALDQDISPTWTNWHAFGKKITVPTMPSSDVSDNAASTKFVDNRVGQFETGVVTVDLPFSMVLEKPLTVVRLKEQNGYQLDLHIKEGLVYGKVIIAGVFGTVVPMTVKIHLPSGVVFTRSIKQTTMAAFEFVEVAKQSGPYSDVTYNMVDLYGLEL